MTRMRTLAIALVALLVLAACSTAGSRTSGGVAAPEDRRDTSQDIPAAAPVPQVTQPEAPAGTTVPQENPTSDRKIARSASVSLVVTDVEAAASQLHQIATASQGLVINERVTVEGRGSSSVQVEVPAERLEETLNEIAKVGEQRSRQVSSTDVTADVADVDSRVATLRASIARLQKLIEQSGSVADIAAVERELTDRQAELESMLAQQRALSQIVAFSTISVSLSTQVTGGDVVTEGGFLGGLKLGWKALLNFADSLLVAVGVLLPFVAAMAVVVVPIVFLVRRRAAVRKAKASKAAETAPEAGSTEAATADSESEGAVPADEAETDAGEDGGADTETR